MAETSATHELHRQTVDEAREIIAGFLLWHDPAYKPSPSESLEKLVASARLFVTQTEGQV